MNYEEVEVIPLKFRRWKFALDKDVLRGFDSRDDIICARLSSLFSMYVFYFLY